MEVNSLPDAKRRRDFVRRDGADCTASAQAARSA